MYPSPKCDRPRHKALFTKHCHPSDLSRIQDDLLEVMPAVEEANSISEELDKLVKFEILIMAPQVLGSDRGQKEVSHKEKQRSTQG